MVLKLFTGLISEKVTLMLESKFGVLNLTVTLSDYTLVLVTKECFICSEKNCQVILDHFYQLLVIQPIFDHDQI